MDEDIGIFSIGGTTPGVHLKFHGETGLLLMGNGNIGIPLQMKQGIGPSSRDEEGEPGLFLSCDRNIGILLQTKQGIGPSSRDEEGKPGLFLSCDGKLGVPLEWRQVCRGTY